jgi:site-specific recombinase XerD
MDAVCRGDAREQVDEYLELVRARARRNTLLATAYDLRVFFGVVDRDPLEVTTADVFGFVKAQRQGSSKVARISDGASGLALSTIRRRLSSLSGFYAYLVATGRRETSPVLRGLATQTSLRRGRRGVPLVRPVRQLPRVHQWAADDTSRRFDDLYNLVYDPGFPRGGVESGSGPTGVHGPPESMG